MPASTCITRRATGAGCPASSPVALLLAGVLRLFLPDVRAGLLGVRGRVRDGLTYLVIGGLILGVAIHLH